MKIVNGAVVREQNENDVDDSCFDTSELLLMSDSIKAKTRVRPQHEKLELDQFIIDGKLQRHPKTKFRNDISSDQAHCYFLATGKAGSFANWFGSEWPTTSNGKPVSIGLYAAVANWGWLKNLSLLFQRCLFWLPVRWCDGENPQLRILGTKWNLGWKHWAGDYRLYINCLKDAPWWIRRLNRKKTLIDMSYIYWKPKEPRVDWYLEIRKKFIMECL